MESQTAYYDIIKALTDKGVHVIEAAGNGNINMDSPVVPGEYDVNVRDSGAILAGAFCAKDGKKRRSAPMARVLPVLHGAAGMW